MAKLSKRQKQELIENTKKMDHATLLTFTLQLIDQLETWRSLVDEYAEIAEVIHQ